MHVTLANLTLPSERDRAAAILGECLTVILIMVVLVSSLLVVFAQEIADHLYGASELSAYILIGSALMAGQLFIQFYYTIYAGFNYFSRYAKISGACSLVSVM